VRMSSAPIPPATRAPPQRASVAVIVAREAIDQPCFEQRLRELRHRPVREQHCRVGLESPPRQSATHARCRACTRSSARVRNDRNDAAAPDSIELVGRSHGQVRARELHEHRFAPPSESSGALRSQPGDRA
jgi:hypothetical protein